jgi:DNA (cytosine-5)-methyltransferase 1
MARSKNTRGEIRAIVEEKLARLRTGISPRVLDLFSGCGGIFLGFQRAGCVSVGGVELDPIASRSYAQNFHADAPAKLFEAHASPRDISDTDPSELLKSWGCNRPTESVDLIVGGPPCPAFARIGRAKLREIRKHPEAFRHDPRVKLYIPYLHHVRALAPVALLMENVPEILNHAGHNLAEEICETLEGFGYTCAYTLLNAAHYGVPQMRERFFLMAIHECAGTAVTFPEPTNHLDLPPGYRGTRQVALKVLKSGDSSSRYMPSLTSRASTRPAVTVGDALADLPPITAHLEGTDKRGARRFVKAVRYRDDVEPSSYAQTLRTWPGFVTSGLLLDHVTRCLGPRDHRLFRRMRPGDDYPRAYALAESLYLHRLKQLARKGEPLKAGSRAQQELRAEYVPPYDPNKFPNKWRKLESDQPARTLMAHLAKDCYSHIHPDSDQARVISVREAARLQSFPDAFVFAGTMNPAFRQIGNSVPPLMSYALACSLLTALGAVEHRDAPADRAAVPDGLSSEICLSV